jgi:hypothetical protein
VEAQQLSFATPGFRICLISQLPWQHLYLVANALVSRPIILSVAPGRHDESPGRWLRALSAGIGTLTGQGGAWRG